MNRIAGISWVLKEFFQLLPDDLLADFNQGNTPKYQIGEIELITAVGIVVFWGDLWNGRQIILLGAGNQNTFSCLDNRVAKRGLALGIMATFHVWCVKMESKYILFIYGVYTTSGPTSLPENHNARLINGREMPVINERGALGGGPLSWHVRLKSTGSKTE